jgi:hypothetical protein
MRGDTGQTRETLLRDLIGVARINRDAPDIPAHYREKSDH